MEYEKCLVELDEVLRFLSVEDRNKIPEDIRNSIKELKDKNYTWNYDSSKELKEQKLNRKTISMLAYLNMEYLLNDEQKELMKKIHQNNEEKLEKSKQEKYNPNKISKNANTEGIKEEVALVEIKEEKWYQRILTFFRRIFKK